MKKTVSILFALFLALSLNLVMVAPAFAAATGNIVNNDLGAQWVAASQQKCVQKATITNPAGAGSLDIDCFAVDNAGGTAVDADVTQVAVYRDTNAPLGTWDAGDALIGSAANFTAATAIGGNNDAACLSVASGGSEVVFVVVTTAAAPTNGNTFKTTINGSDLTTTTGDTWDGTGGIATATSATTIDAVKPTATTTTTVDPIYESALVQTVIVTYDESMDTATTPTITLTGVNWGPQAAGVWDTAVFANDRYTTTFTHDGTQEEIAAEVATVASGSGATDVAGNTDVGDASPPFVVDTQKPTVVIASAAPDPTNTSPIPVTATFSENVTGFVVGDITVGNGAAGNFAGGPAVYTFDVTPAGQGLVTVDIGAGVAQDVASNNNTAAVQFSITYDSVAPTVAITSTAPDPTNNSPIPVTATFSENVTGFVIGDLTVVGGITSNFVPVSGTVYTFDVSPTILGVVRVDIAGGVAQDAAGNGNTAAAQFSITYGVPGGGGEVSAVSGVGSLSLIYYVNWQGNATADISLASIDRLVTMSIPSGTLVLDAQGNPLGSIQIVILSTPPPPPRYALVGRAYDCLPAGATFQPAITLTFKYREVDIPEGASEEDLVLAYWHGGKWVNLSTTVNAATNTVTAEVAHFTPFAILAYTGAPAFGTSDLSITPAEVDVGDEVTISLLVANTGDRAGSYEVTLEIDNVVVATEAVTLAAGASERVTFTTAKDVAGTYTVSVGGLSGTFVVKQAAPPLEAAPPEGEEAQPLNTWIVVGIIAAVIVVVLVAVMLGRGRRRA